MPASLRRSITFDNGTEFTRHHRIDRQLAIQAFFCDPHAPWQKDGIENAIGRLRRYLPRKTSLDDWPTTDFDALIAIYNTHPRKYLDSQPTPEDFIPTNFKI